MSDFVPDYSSPEALRQSYLDHAAAMRKAAILAQSEAGRQAFIEAAEDAEEQAKDMDVTHA